MVVPIDNSLYALFVIRANKVNNSQSKSEYKEHLKA